MQEISFKYINKRTRVALLLDKRDESKSPLEVQVLSYDDNNALVIHYNSILLCDIEFIDGVQFLRRKEEVFRTDDYITL